MPRKPKAETPAPLPPLRLEWRSPAELAENPANWRRHPEAQINALSDVLSEVGWAGACLYNERTQRLIDGHARKKVALDQGAERIPVLVGSWDEETERKILATLDPLAAMAESDSAALDALLRGVQTSSQAVGDMLTALAEKAGIVPQGIPPADDPGPQIDRAAELQEKWGTATGQLWIIPSNATEGKEHRLLCGDSTKAEDVAKVMKGEKAFLMVTDPPYGVDYDPNWRNEAAEKGHISHADRRVGDVTNDDRIDWSEAWALADVDVVYCWHADRHASSTQRSLESAGFEIRLQIIWGKSRFAISRGHYHWQHEPCWYAVRKGSTAKWAGDHSQTTLWAINLDENVEGGHSTQKPLECMARPMRNHGEAGDIVYEPFSGSGTTFVAAEQTGRLCRGIEISPGYVAVALERLAGMGLSPQLECVQLER